MGLVSFYVDRRVEPSHTPPFALMVGADVGGEVVVVGCGFFRNFDLSMSFVVTLLSFCSTCVFVAGCFRP